MKTSRFVKVRLWWVVGNATAITALTRLRQIQRVLDTSEDGLSDEELNELLKIEDEAKACFVAACENWVKSATVHQSICAEAKLEPDVTAWMVAASYGGGTNPNVR